MDKSFKKKYLAAVFISLAVAAGSYFVIRANPSATVQFTTDAIISLSGISNGDLYVANGSECATANVSGASLAVTGIPDGGFFKLKTPQYNNALKVTPSGGTLGLDISSSNLSAGKFSRWLLSSSGVVTVSHIVAVADQNTKYDIKIDGQYFSTFISDAAREVSFNYTGSGSNRVFTIELNNTPGGAGGLPAVYLTPPSPPAPSIENPEGEFKVLVPEGEGEGETPAGEIIIATSTANRTITLKLFAGPDVKKMTISEDPNFTNADIIPYQETYKWTLSKGYGVKTIYVKFFTEFGVPSETISVNIILLPSTAGPKGAVNLTPVAFPPASSTSTISAPGSVKLAPAKKVKEQIRQVWTTSNGKIYHNWADTSYAYLAEKIVQKVKEGIDKVKIFAAKTVDKFVKGVNKITPEFIKKGVDDAVLTYDYIMEKVKVGLIKFILKL
jgi:hypothetical protein